MPAWRRGRSRHLRQSSAHLPARQGAPRHRDMGRASSSVDRSAPSRRHRGQDMCDGSQPASHPRRSSPAPSSSARYRPNDVSGRHESATRRAAAGRCRAWQDRSLTAFPVQAGRIARWREPPHCAWRRHDRAPTDVRRAIRESECGLFSAHKPRVRSAAMTRSWLQPAWQRGLERVVRRSSSADEDSLLRHSPSLAVCSVRRAWSASATRLASSKVLAEPILRSFQAPCPVLISRRTLNQFAVVHHGGGGHHFGGGLKRPQIKSL